MDHVPNSCLMRIKSGEEGSPRRTTACAIIHLREIDTICGKLINVWGLNFPTEAPDV